MIIYDSYLISQCILGSGEMKMTSNGMLPENTNTEEICKSRGGCFLAGDVRANENMMLTSMHTLWVRQHNKIAKELKRLNTSWKENKLFETARKIVGAIFQHIVYNEYVPKIAKLHKYIGYRSRKNAAISNSFSTAAYRFGHSMVQNNYAQLDKNFNQASPNVPLRNLYFDSSIMRKNGIERTVFGLVGNSSKDVNTKFSRALLKKLFIPPGKRGVADLTALNLQRGRDHGIPTYGSWRKLCGLRSLRGFC